MAENLTEEGMKRGIERAENFVLFLSAGVASRRFVAIELRHAIALKKPIILVHEEDDRHGKSRRLLQGLAWCDESERSSSE